MTEIGLVGVATLTCNLLSPQIEAQEGNFPVLTGPYLGQRGPGDSPELFAPGYITRQNYFQHSTAVSFPDMRAIYWSAYPNTEHYYHLYFMEMAKDKGTSVRLLQHYVERT